jgi:hypothetical protein
MSQAKLSARYRIYLLYVWREGDESGSGPSNLRFRPKDPRTSESHGFDGPETLMKFLHKSLAERGESDEIVTLP